MDIRILYYKPDEYIKETFENIYQSLAPKEYRQLTQTGIYGKYNTEEAAIGFTVYKENDNKIGIIFISETIREGKLEEEKKMICIESDKKNYISNYTHFMIISQSQKFIKILETGGKELKPGLDFKYIQGSTIRPIRKRTILLEQNDEIKCTVIEDKYGRGRIIKTKTWENSKKTYDEDKKIDKEDSKISQQTYLDRSLEKGKELPELFEDKVKEYNIETILKKYIEEQLYESKRKKIELYFSLNPTISKPSSPRIIKKL